MYHKQVLVSIDEANAVNLQRQNGLVRVIYDFEGQTPLELSLRKVCGRFDCRTSL
jgi:hypothetical protein